MNLRESSKGTPFCVRLVFLFGVCSLAGRCPTAAFHIVLLKNNRSFWDLWFGRYTIAKNSYGFAVAKLRLYPEVVIDARAYYMYLCTPIPQNVFLFCALAND